MISMRNPKEVMLRRPFVVGFINFNTHVNLSFDYSASAANNSIAFPSAPPLMIAFLVFEVKPV